MGLNTPLKSLIPFLTIASSAERVEMLLLLVFFFVNLLMDVSSELRGLNSTTEEVSHWFDKTHAKVELSLPLFKSWSLSSWYFWNFWKSRKSQWEVWRSWKRCSTWSSSRRGSQQSSTSGDPVASEWSPNLWCRFNQVGFFLLLKVAFNFSVLLSYFSLVSRSRILFLDLYKEKEKMSCFSFWVYHSWHTQKP